MKFDSEFMKKIVFLLHIFLSIFLYGKDTSSTLKLDYHSKYKNSTFPYPKQNTTKVKDSIRTRILVEEALKKAKGSGSIVEISNAYYKLASLSEEKESLLYADSIIAISKDIKDYDYPAKAYLFKARVYGAKSRYQKAMDELIKANQYANENKNIDQQYQTKYFIAVLRGNLGDDKEALKLLQSITNYYSEKFKGNKKQYQAHYIRSLYALGDSYNANKEYDQAYITNKKAIELSLKFRDSTLYGGILLSSGMTHFHKKEYASSIDSINKLKKISLNRKESDGTVIRADLMLGRNYFEQGNIDKALYHFNIADSTAFRKKNFFPSIRSMYETLIKYNKDQQNVEKQLFYIDRLLKLDSILDKDFKYLYQQIDKKYYTPNLILEKQIIIDSLEKQKKNTIFIVVALSLISALLLLFLFQNIKKKKTYRKRFVELLEKTGNDKITEKAVSSEKSNSTMAKQLSNHDDIGISQVIINDILKNLALFEENHHFIESNITVSILAKQFKTNSKYLSKVINIHKKKSFSNYINDLRIDYIVEKLKTDAMFRRYTIKAIAKEVGFNTSEAFSKSFFKSTGIYPSFFLKELEKVAEDHKL